MLNNAASIGGADAGAVDLDGTTLSWSGALAVGETVTITYSLTVNADSGGGLLANMVTGTATPPGGETIAPPPGSTERPVKTPLAVTGALAAPWLLTQGSLLLGEGGFLLAARRRKVATSSALETAEAEKEVVVPSH